MLQDPEGRRRYESEISNQFETLGSMIEKAGLDEALEIKNSTIQNAAEKVIGS